MWWQFGPLGQMATRDDIAQLRAELHETGRELRESTRARQRIGVLVVNGKLDKLAGKVATLEAGHHAHVNAPGLHH